MSQDPSERLLAEAERYTREGKYADAILEYEQLVELQPASRHVWLCHIGALLGRLGQNMDSLDYHEKALKLDPKCELAILNKGLALGALRRNDRALEAFDQLVELNPRHAQAWYERGIALTELGRIEEAIGSYDETIAIDPHHKRAVYNRGTVFGRTGRHAEALACFERAIEIDSEYIEALTNRATALRQLRRFDEALAAVDRALSVSPKAPNGWFQRGAILFEDFERHAEALECLERARSLGHPSAAGAVEAVRSAMGPSAPTSGASPMDMETLNKWMPYYENGAILRDVPERLVPEIVQMCKRYNYGYETHRQPDGTWIVAIRGSGG